MDQDSGFFTFIQQQSSKLLSQTLAHIGLTMISLFLAILIAVPLGVWISRKPKFAGAVLGVAGVLQTIPSIALLGILIPVLGIGPKPAIFALFLYALLPIVRNTYTGLSGVSPVVVDAAKGMGMNNLQVLFKVELPLSFAVIMAGVRTATVINVGVATLAAYIAAGGLGEFIFGGIALNNTNMILAGAIPAALLAVLLDFMLSRVQRLRLKKVVLWKVALPVIILTLSSFYLLPTKLGGRLLAGFTPEFIGREDGYIGLKSLYNLDMETVVISDAVMYKAARDKHLDVISGYSTDGRLKAYSLITLEDDLKLFPAYQAAPLITEDALLKFPGLEAVLNQLSGKISEAAMTGMNYKLDQLKQSPEKVALDFMVAHNLYKKPKPLKAGKSPAPTVRIGSKIFGEQYILAQIYRILILGNTDFQVETKTGLGGTKICFDALQNKQIDFYPEYTGTGLLVILQPDRQMREKLRTDIPATKEYLDREFHQKYRLKWLEPIGFNNTYALMMRKEQAAELGIKTITDLTNQIKN